MLNKVQIIGRLGKDVDLKYTQGGEPVARFSVATDESYTDRDGNKVSKAEWHNVVIWGKLGEHCNNYIGKGSLVYVEGKLETRKYKDKEGLERWITEIKAQRVQFLDRKSDGQEGGKKASRGNVAQSEDYGSPFPSEASDMDSAPF